MATPQHSDHMMTGIGLVVLGVAALGLAPVLTLPAGGLLRRYAPSYSSDQGSYGSLGERIPFTGTGETGRPIPRSSGVGMMSTALGYLMAWALAAGLQRR